MKKFLPFLSFALFAIACNTKQETAQAPQQTTVDTTGFAQYQTWKAQQEMGVQQYEPQQQPVQEVQVAQAPKIKYVRVPVVQKAAPVKRVEAPVQAPATSTTSRESEKRNETTTASSGTTGTSGNNGSVATTGTGTEQPKAEEKTGMKNSTKGAVIGGVVGGAAGAVINKRNPAVGAVIGAVIGAGGGYIIGKKTEKKQVQQ
jgi:hypothetical protein